MSMHFIFIAFTNTDIEHVHDFNVLGGPLDEHQMYTIIAEELNLRWNQ